MDPQGQRLTLDIIGFGSTGPAIGPVLTELLKRQGELTDRIDEAEMRWLELHEALEAIPAD